MTKQEKIKDNILLEKLVNNDQSDRQDFFRNPELVIKKDMKRRDIVDLLLEKKLVKTSKDYFNAALIYLHGSDIKDYKRARDLSRKSCNLKDNLWSKWLFATTTDRLFLRLNQKQKFGTQYKIISVSDRGREKKKYQVFPIDKRTSDKTRAEHAVAPLKVYLAKNNTDVIKVGGKKINKIVFDE
ncbi:MAG: hypothetical protein WAV11_02945 [Minisyncoccia bacterium]